MNITKPCGHVDPNDGGRTDSALHGVCIFCWRDRCGKLNKQNEALQVEYAYVLQALAECRQQLKLLELASGPVSAAVKRAENAEFSAREFLSKFVGQVEPENSSGEK